MKKHITQAAALLACMAVLASCGIITADDTEKSSSVTESTSSSEAISVTSSESEADIEQEGNILASAKAENSMGSSISSPVPDAGKLYEDVRELLDPDCAIDGYDDPGTLTVAFKVGDEKYILSYCGDSIFAWHHKNGTAYYSIGHTDAEQLRSRMAAYAVLGEIIEGQYSIDTAPTKTDLLNGLAESTKKALLESRSYYVDNDTSRCYNISVSDSKVYYSQYPIPYYITDDDFYEYFSDGDKHYCRISDDIVYYESDIFEGELDIESLPAWIIRDFEYRESFSVTADGAYTVEIFDGEEYTAYLLFDDSGSLCAEWSLGDYDITLISDYSIATESIDFDTLFSQAAENSADVFNKTDNKSPLNDDNWLAYDTEKFGLFDLSGEIVEGKEIQGSNVVQSWREYISGGNPFTVEYRFAGAGRNEYELCTFDGKEYYYRNDMDIHDGDRNLGSEEIFIGDRLYQSVYYTDEYDTREFTGYPISMYGDNGASCPIDLLFDTDYDGEMTRAYEVTIDGEDYICEEWALYLDRLYKVYIKDGQIVAYLGDFYKKPVVYTFSRLEKTADSSLIKKPDNAKNYQWND